MYNGRAGGEKKQGRAAVATATPTPHHGGGGESRGRKATVDS